MSTHPGDSTDEVGGPQARATSAPPVLLVHGTFSQGGLLAQQLAARTPCAALVLLASVPPIVAASVVGQVAPPVIEWLHRVGAVPPIPAGSPRPEPKD